MKIKQIGIDIGKMTYHMVALNEANEIVIRRQFTRSQLIHSLPRERISV